jgi:hypothetical protein
MDWATKDAGLGAFNLGIYNCRTTVGGVNRSIHGDGRACDFGFRLVNGRANPNGWVMINRLLPHVRELGIQMLIWDRRIWSARTPNGAPYGGAGKSPHIDHIHAELTWNAARTLTRDRVRVVVGRTGVAQTPRPVPAPTPTPTPPPVVPDPEDDDMATYIRLNMAKGSHPHAGRVEAVTAMHRRWVPGNEFALVNFLGGKVVNCPDAKSYNAWTSNKQPVGTNPINGPL